MRRKIAVTMLIFIITLETFTLYNQNKDVKEKINNYKKELSDNNLIVDGEVTLEEIIKNKEELQQTTILTFKEENIEKVFEDKKELEENLNQDILVLESQILGLESKLNTLQKEYNKLYKEYEERNTFYITNFPFINQYPDYPTGCESVSLTMLLNYYGVIVTPDDIISHLPKGSLPYTKDGIVYGGNPDVEFIGTPYSLNSYGVYEKPLAEVANKFKSGINIATGTNFDEILKIVGTGKPVLVWTSMHLRTPYISKSWIYEPTGERIYWKSNEHAVVVIGYTPTNVIIADPLGGSIKYQSLSIFRERYNYYGKKALYY